ncbi:MAG TPA: wax ester/triacylglycerol synthase family O-acyltransferase [Casimicrobiaceae bacterium]|nr:wax ester/triacylglycerol synthase family O-acyltransferase [Casimicrobiaceae bacterium]
MRQLTGQDAMFLYLDQPHASTHGLLVYLYDQSTAPGGIVRFKDILRHVEANLHLAPFFRKKLLRVPLELDFPYLVDDEDFDLNYHVRHIALPKPGDWRQFCIQASRIVARPLDLARPLWEMYVVEGLDNVDFLPKGSFAILTKLHHSVVDGTALSELTWQLHAQTPAVKRPRPKRWTPEKPPETLSLLSRAAYNNALASLRTGKALATVGPKVAALAGKLAADAAAGRHKVPNTRFNKSIGKERVFDGAQFPFADVRAIKAAVEGATVNDTVTAIVGGALRRYLRSKGEAVEPSLAALMPINTRQDAAERQTQGNTIAVMTAAVRTDIADPLERIAAIHAGTSRSKEVSKAIGARELTDLTKHTPAPTMMLASKLLLMGNFGGNPRLPFHNCCISNVPGPQFPLYLLGAKLLFISVVAPLTDGASLFFAVMSYDGKLIVTVTSAPEIVPDPAFMATCLRESFAEMKKAAQKAAKETPRKGSVPKRVRHATA